jgi:hypothetical protein
MNIPIERLHTTLESLGLKALQARLENLLEQASKKEPSYADFLDELLNCELEARRMVVPIGGIAISVLSLMIGWAALHIGH